MSRFTDGACGKNVHTWSVKNWVNFVLFLLYQFFVTNFNRTSRLLFYLLKYAILICSTTIKAPKIVPMFPAYFIFNSLLILLLFLHIIWTWLILKIAYNAIYAGQVRDVWYPQKIASENNPSCGISFQANTIVSNFWCYSVIVLLYRWKEIFGAIVATMFLTYRWTNLPIILQTTVANTIPDKSNTNGTFLGVWIETIR